MEDLQSRTLRAVSGLLAKLAYLSSLRETDGSYSHWGLARVHGDLATQHALRDAHRGIVTKILRTPLPVLLRDIDQSRNPEEGQAVDFIQKLKDHPAQLMPPEPGPGTERHLSSVLHALLRLAKTRR